MKKKLFERRGNFIIADRMNQEDFMGVCELCGKEDELRPYGPNNKNICIECAKKDPEGTADRFWKMMQQQ